jgi:hypothetical protein
LIGVTVRNMRVVQRVRHAVRRLSRRDRLIVERKIRAGRRAGESVELTVQEVRVLFDEIALRELGISGKEFLRRLDHGDLPDSPVVEHLTLLAGGPRAS